MIIGGSERTDIGPPEGKGRFIFEPYGGVIDAEGFETTDADSLVYWLTIAFGPFRLVAMSENEWSVEQPTAILGTVTKASYEIGCLGCTEKCERDEGASDTGGEDVTYRERGSSDDA